MRELLTARGSSVVDVRYAPALLLLAAGLSPAAVEQVEEIRRPAPAATGRSDRLLGDEPARPHPAQRRRGLGVHALRHGHVEGFARAKRSVAALVERAAVQGPDPIRVVCWYDSAF
ncbi:MAG: hypothetical protein R2748_29160 [Bryobacterales bacterium]